MGTRATRLLHSVHKWTGLVSGINILLLSVTGAYLVFDAEIDRLFAAPRGEVVATIDPHGATPLQAALDGIVKLHPNAKPTIVFRAKHEDDRMELLFQGDGPTRYRLNTVTGEVYTMTDGTATPVNRFILLLHDSLFLARPGIIYLGIVSIVFLTSTLTGIFIYGPFMKQAVFGLIRRDKGVRRYFAELHKLLGCVSLAFNAVIAVTGIALTFGFMATRAWMLPAITLASQGGMPLPAGAPTPAVDAVIASAAAAQPGLGFGSMNFPGPLQGANHYLVFLSRWESITRTVPHMSVVPVAAISDVHVIPVPLWVQAIYLCLPFHFGDFAGLGMKAVYCLFGLSSGALSVSGAVLSFSAWGKQWRSYRRNRRRRLVPAEPVPEGPRH